MNSGIGSGLGPTTNTSSVERLFVVDGGYLVDKYFGNDVVNFS